MKTLRSVLLLFVFLTLLAGCTSDQSAPPEGAWINGRLDEPESGENQMFTVTIDEPGEPIGIDFRGALISGSLTARLTDESGAVVWEHTAETPGAFSVTTVVNPPEVGDYQLGLAWVGPASAQYYSLRWQPGEIVIPTVSPVALISGIGMILVALGYAAYALSKGPAWGYLGLGALAWIVTVAVKFALALPLNESILALLYDSLPEPAALGIFDVYVGALTGLTEVMIVWLVLRYTRLGRAAWPKVLAFGIAFGAIEALLLGFSALANVIAGMTMSTVLGPDVMGAIARANNPLYALAPVAERLALVMIHLCANALLFYGVSIRQSRWLWLAFLLKTAVDTIAAAAQFWGVETVAKVWTIEASMLAFGAISWLGVRWLQARYPADAGATVEVPGEAQAAPA